MKAVCPYLSTSFTRNLLPCTLCSVFVLTNTRRCLTYQHVMPRLLQVQTIFVLQGYCFLLKD